MGGDLKGNSADFNLISVYLNLRYKVKLNSTFGFLCLWDTASKSLVLPGQEELQTVYPSPFLSHPRQASAMFVLRGFSGSGRQKPLMIENYALLNKRNVSITVVTMSKCLFLYQCQYNFPYFSIPFNTSPRKGKQLLNVIIVPYCKKKKKFEQKKIIRKIIVIHNY